MKLGWTAGLVVGASLLVGGFPGTCEAQCVPLSSTNFGEMLPNAGCGVFASYAGMITGSYFRMPVLPGADYGISTCGTSIDTQLTGFQGLITNTAIFFNDDGGPYCGGLAASVRVVPDFNDYTRVNVNEYDCLPYTGANPTVTVQVRQNNNLAITSSLAAMCEGQTRTLTAMPAPVAAVVPGAGNPGTFSGTGVSGSTFTAPSPTPPWESFTIGYAYGYCSSSGTIRVYTDAVADAGEDQVVCSETGEPLDGNPPPTGVTGIWTGPPGVTFSPGPSDPNAVPSGLSPGANELTWSFTNGPCGDSDTVVVTRADDFSVTAGDDQSVCGGTSDPLGGSAPPAGGSGLWTGPVGVGFIPSADDPDAAATGLSVGQTTVTWEVTNGFCHASEDVVVERRSDLLTVSTAAPSGPGSLREVLDATCPDGVVGFEPHLAGAVIDVGSLGELAVDLACTIDGSGLAARPVLDGGGLSRIFAVGPAGDLTLDSVDLAGGAAAEGGAIHNQGVVRLRRATVSGSAATASSGRGGAIYSAPGSGLEVEASTLAFNATASSGDGGAVFADAGSVVSVSNSTVTGNVTGPSGIGGGIAAEDAELQILDSTVSDNHADLIGGGLSVAGSFSQALVVNTVAAGNTADIGAPDVVGHVASGGFNLIGDGSGSSGWGPDDAVGTGAAPIDPRLGRLGPQGAGAWVQLPLAGSPIIDAGSCRSASVIADQRGVARPYDDPFVPNRDDGCDIGAVEALSPLFGDGFESGGVSAWSASTP